MAAPRIARSGLRSPRGWLFLAFLGVWLYLASQLLRLYPARVAEVVVLPVSEVREILALSAGLGQLLFFGGLVAALWRANLAAGVSNAGIRGLAFGVAGVGILGVFEFALFLDWLGAAFNPMAVFARSPVLDTGVIAGTALAFAGLASLVVGFAQSTDRFGRPRLAPSSDPRRIGGSFADQTRAHRERRRRRDRDDRAAHLPSRRVHLLSGWTEVRYAAVVRRHGTGGATRVGLRLRSGRAARGSAPVSRGNRSPHGQGRSDCAGGDLHRARPRVPGMVRERMSRRDERVCLGFDSGGTSRERDRRGPVHRPHDRDEARLLPRVGGRSVPRAWHDPGGTRNPVDPRRGPRGGAPRPHGRPKPGRIPRRQRRRVENRAPHDAGSPGFGLRSRPRIVPDPVRRSGLPSGFSQDLSDVGPARDGTVRTLEIRSLCADDHGRGRRVDRAREDVGTAMVADSSGAAGDRCAGNSGWAEEGRSPRARAREASGRRPAMRVRPVPRGGLPT